MTRTAVVQHGFGATSVSDRGVLAVVDKRAVAAGVAEFTLARPDGSRLPDWTPGAHIDIGLPDGSTRQYSLCGDRWDASRYRIAVQRQQCGRGGSVLLHDRVEVGDTLSFGGPRNNFRLVPAERYLFIAGGIGITPIIPMIAQADLVGARWELLYLGRTKDRLAYLDVLATREQVNVYLSHDRGRTSLHSWRPELPTTRVYACGPTRLLDAVEAWGAVPGGGLPPRIERFSASSRSPAGPAKSFEVVAARSGVAVNVAPNVSIVDAFAEAGVEILTSCAQGVCGTCETEVLEGLPEHRDSLLDDRERADNRCMFPCVSRCEGERLVLDL